MQYICFSNYLGFPERSSSKCYRGGALLVDVRGSERGGVKCVNKGAGRSCKEWGAGDHSVVSPYVPEEGINQ